MSRTEAQKRYARSEKGKASRMRYFLSEKGKAARARYMANRKARLEELKKQKNLDVKPAEIEVKNNKKVSKKARYDWINPFDKIAFYASRQAWLPRLVSVAIYSFNEG